MIDTTAPSIETYQGTVATLRAAISAYRANATAVRRLEHNGGCTRATERAIERRDKDNQRIALWIEQHTTTGGRETTTALRDEDNLRRRIHANRHPRPELEVRLRTAVRLANAYAQAADAKRWLTEPVTV